MNTLDWQPSRTRRRRGRFVLLALLAAILFGGGTALSYYVDALWFNSMGFLSVFSTTLKIEALVFALFASLTFAILYGALLALKPAQLAELTGGTIMINGQPFKLPVGPVLRLLTAVVALIVAVITGLGMMAEWQTLALYWYGAPAGPADAMLDPILGRPVTFYLFALPALKLLAGWLTTLAVIICIASVLTTIVTSGTRVLSRRQNPTGASLGAVSMSLAFLLVVIAWQVYLGRFERLFADGRIFDGVTYTEAHITLTGSLIVSGALIAGALIAGVTAFTGPKIRWLLASAAPAVVCSVATGLIGAYVNNFLVKPNELVRERPYITNNIELTRKAYALDHIEQQPFPAEPGVAAANVAENIETLQNIRLWDWRALQDTLRQIQEIRGYYDFPDIDIDRYEIDGVTRQMMLAVRELNVERLPDSSRGWINEKLIYTHGYGLTMNPVNGFTPEGLPTLVVSNMPVQSTVPALTVNRPEIYFGELTNGDVYVRTNQKEFNYPQGESNSTTVYEGQGGVRLGGYLRKMLIAVDRGDLTKLPFSDAITPESRLLMHRNIRERIGKLADFLTLDPDPYIVIGDEGRLYWMVDGFTTSTTYRTSSHTRLGNESINYMRNSVKIVVDAYDGTVTLYVFDPDDPIIARYRTIFPTLFTDASAMPATLRKHVRYPELMLDMQAAVFGLYHMTNPDAFYNREDLWNVASETGSNDRRETVAQVMEPNFVLMKLPGEKAMEFVEILPFTPTNRSNMIAWIAGRSDDAHYGTAIVYDFPKTRLVDGPQQIESRIDQNPQLAGQISLWNQQGSHVRRGALLVIPIGKALLYAEPIYLQADRSPMPELRLVVLALQDRLGYGPTFEAAMASLFGDAAPSLPGAAEQTSTSAAPRGAGVQTSSAPPGSANKDPLIAAAARDLADYQRLTSEGKLGEAGQKLEALKSKLEQLMQRP